jgi:uncharacterized membrane protein YkoI
MKKCILLTAFGITAAVLTSSAIAQQTQTANCSSCCSAKVCANSAAKKFISKEAAINAALAHAGLKRADVRDLKCELDRENGIMVYEVEFESGLFDYEYDIDAVTGKILKSKKELD